MNILSSIIYS